MSKFNEMEEFEESPSHIAWYTMRILSINEDKVVSNMHEKIKYYDLEQKILDIQIVREFVVEESKDFLPNDSELPMRTSKNSEKTMWVQTPYGTIKKIKLVEKRPFKGMVFIKLLFDHDLIKVIKSWDRTTYFLGDPNPQAMTEESFIKMKSSINTLIPCLHEYVKENNYSIISGTLRNAPIMQVQENERREILKKIEEKKAKEQQREQEKAIEANDSSYSKTVSRPSTQPVIGKPIKDINKLKVNDYVFVSDFGAQGQVKSIDVSTGEIIVSIQAFGRSQPITCDISKLHEI